MNQEIEVFLWHYINYQQNDWIEWLAAAEFQYNNKKHMATGHTLFKLNFGRHPWKGNLTVQMEFPKVEQFLIRLQRSWEKAMKSMEKAIWQEEIKSIRIESREQHVVRSQKHPFKLTLKETGLEKIWTF